MALVNGKILKGDDCPYKGECGHMKYTACNGDGCPFIDETEHFRDFSCGGARFIKLMKDGEEKDNDIQ